MNAIVLSYLRYVGLKKRVRATTTADPSDRVRLPSELGNMMENGQKYVLSE